jgi:dihydroorotate dehydrogenase
MIFAPPQLMPLLRLLDAETAHKLTIKALRSGLVGAETRGDDPILGTELFGRALTNPIGLAAGFDKNAEVVNEIAKLGFGFVEAGTVTPRPQSGNPRPRLFRLKQDRAVINRMGFNNGGLDVYLENIKRIDKARVVFGANVGINKEGAEPERDYPALVNAVGPFADYITINISSPNTPGLRDLQGEERLAAILSGIKSPKPVFVKIAPDLSDEGLEAVISVAVQYNVTGLIVSNTTIARPATLRSPLKHETGGLSGTPLFAPSTAMLAKAYRLSARKLTLIGAGGVFGPEDAFAKILAGASAVQLYTGFAYQGPAMLRPLKSGLARLLRERGFKNVAQAVGAGL